MNSNSAHIDRLWHVTHGKGRYRVEANGILVGNDLIVAIYGGVAPHIGAVAIAIPRPSITNPHVTSVTSSVFTLIGHKDDIIAKREAEMLATSLNCVVVVIAGIHIEHATKLEIRKLLRASRASAKSLLNQILPLREPPQAGSKGELSGSE